MDFVFIVLLFLTIEHVTPTQKYQQNNELNGFQDVAEHLLSGNRVFYYVDLPDCSRLYGTGYGSNGFGNYIDLFTLINDKDVAEYPFFKTSSVKFTRNSTDGLISVIKELSVSSTEEANVTIVVSTTQENIVLERHTYRCLLGSKSSIHFYADRENTIELESFEDVHTTLLFGGQVRFVAEYHICRGGFEFSVGGAEIKDFDVTEESDHDVIKSTSSRIMIDDSGYSMDILTTKLYDTRQVVFTESVNDAIGLAPQSEKNFTCYLQGHAPGGSVRFYQL